MRLRNFLPILQGIILGAFVTITPLALIHHRQLPDYFQHLDWPTQVFIALCLMQSILSCFYQRLSKFYSAKLLLVLSYLICYIACCALCQKLAITMLLPATNAEINASSFACACPIVVLAWFLMIIAIAIHFTVLVKRSLSQPALEAPISALEPQSDKETDCQKAIKLSWLLFLIGVSFNFDVWLPLIAIPGIRVALDWLD